MEVPPAASAVTRSPTSTCRAVITPSNGAVRRSKLVSCSKRDTLAACAFTLASATPTAAFALSTSASRAARVNRSLSATCLVAQPSAASLAKLWSCDERQEIARPHPAADVGLALGYIAGGARKEGRAVEGLQRRGQLERSRRVDGGCCQGADGRDRFELARQIVESFPTPPRVTPSAEPDEK